MLDYSKNKYTYVLFYLAYLSLAIFTEYPAVLSIKFIYRIDVVFTALILAFFTVFLILNKNAIKNIRIHYLVFLLLIRLVVFVINASVIKVESGHIASELIKTLYPIVLFTFSYNFLSDTKQEIKNLFVLFTLLLSVQLFLLFILNGFSLNKEKIVMGIGYSNYGATFLLLGVSYLAFTSTNIFEKIVIGLGVLSILLTQSFGAYLALFVVIVIALVLKINWKSKKSRMLFLISLLGVLLILGLFFLTTLGSSVFDKIIEKLKYLFQGDFNSFGSSRIKLYTDTWQNIKQNIWFGNIENVISNSAGVYKQTRAHNILLESLLNYGIVGTLINIAIVVLIVLSIRKSLKNTKGNNPCLIALIAVLVHGLVEPNFFTIHFEFFVWLIIGALLNGKNTEKYSMPLFRIKTDIK